MAGATLSVLGNILKEYYLGPVREQLNNSVLWTQILKVDSENLVGNEAVIPLHTSRTSGIGSRAELDTLPAAGNQDYKKAVFDLKYHYARIQVSGQALHKTSSDSGAFLRAMQSELDGARNDLALDFARQVYGDGTGQIAQCGTTTASANVVLASDEALQKGFLYVGMTVDIGTAADPDTLVAGTTISDVDVANKIITIGSSITTSSSNFVYRAGNVDPTSGAVKEMDAGLQKLVATAANSVGGINAASAGNRIWDNQRDTAGGAISLDNLMIDANKVYNQGVTADQLTALTTPGVARRLFATSDFKSNVRFVNSQQLKGGFEQLSFSAGAGQVTLTTDRLAPYGKLFFIPNGNFRLFSPADWDFLAKDGQTVKWVQDKDAFQSILFRYANMGTNRRNNSLVMSGLTDTGF